MEQNKPLIWIMAGTGEARRLIKELQNEQVTIVASVATNYGEQLLEPQDNLLVKVGRMDRTAMADFLQIAKPYLVVDATHPYATEVTRQLKEVCDDAQTPYLRLLRAGESSAAATLVNDYQEAVELLAHKTGPVFLTTGSKALPIFTMLPNYAERITLRILPMQASLASAIGLGFKRSQIICMQGPFSVALNEAMFAAAQAKYVVTKDSGEAGGFSTKRQAAANIGAKLIVVKRQSSESGIDYAHVVGVIKTTLADRGRG